MSPYQPQSPAFSSSSPYLADACHVSMSISSTLFIRSVITLLAVWVHKPIELAELWHILLFTEWRAHQSMTEGWRMHQHRLESLESPHLAKGTVQVSLELP